MGRLIKFILVLALVAGAVGVISFAGAFMKMKGYLGNNLPPLGPWSWALVPRAEQFDKKPVWKFQYATTQMQGLNNITIFVSPTGAVVGTVPANLSARLESYRRTMP